MDSWGKLLKKLKAAIGYVSGLNIPAHAAHAGYFMVLSLFPMLVLLLGLLRSTGIAVQTLTDLLEGVIPKALLPGAKRLIHSTYQSTSAAALSISALAAVWSASRGIYGLQRGLNAIYEVKESRGYFYTRAVSAVYTVAFLLVLLLTLVLSVLGDALLRQFPETLLSGVIDVRLVLLLIIQTGLFTAMFMVLPNRRNRFWNCLPGALAASVGWLVFSDLYSIYVAYFGGYASIYGSVYAVALSMLWLYWCMCLLFYGGAFNAYLMKKRNKFL